MKIPVKDIIRNPSQPRFEFDENSLQSLAESMKTNGLLNPIAVRKNPHWYILIDGERRWRAAKLLGWETIEANIIDQEMGEHDLLQKAIIGNLQREDMNPIEEANAFLQLKDQGLTYAEIASMVGKTSGHVYLRVDLLKLPDEVIDLYAKRKLPIDIHFVKELNSLPADQCIDVARLASARKWTARVASRYARVMKKYGKLTEEKAKRPYTKRVKEDGSWDVFDLLELDLVEKQEEKSFSFALIQVACDKSCKSCALFDVASSRTCKECPLPVFLRKLFE
jgi:ParB family chromosome partitioning protein